MIIKCQKPEECLSLFLKLEVVDIIGIYQGDIRDITWNSMGITMKQWDFGGSVFPCESKCVLNCTANRASCAGVHRDRGCLLDWEYITYKTNSIYQEVYDQQ